MLERIVNFILYLNHLDQGIESLVDFDLIATLVEDGWEGFSEDIDDFLFA